MSRIGSIAATETTETTYPVYWPRGAKTAKVHPLARRPASLEGKTVAFLWDYMFRGDEIFALVQEKLARQFPGVRFIGHAEFGSTHGDEEQRILAGLPDRIRNEKIDAIVSGMGC